MAQQIVKSRVNLLGSSNPEVQHYQFHHQAVLLAAESGDKLVLDSIIQFKTPFDLFSVTLK